MRELLVLGGAMALVTAAAGVIFAWVCEKPQPAPIYLTDDEQRRLDAHINAYRWN